MRIRLSITIWLVASAAAAAVEFRKHVLNPEFQAEAAAAGDINGDGRLDIIAGEHWYEAPDWKPYRFRTVVMDGGYMDIRCDHSEDLDGDGRVDIVTVRRAGNMEWLRNPGRGGAEWKSHHIGHTPLSEGAVFADVDRDGRIDIVAPAGEKGEGIGWWRRGSDPARPWTMVMVGPKGGDPHGIGVGDINRDGRTDILTRVGWYQAPADPTQPDWLFHELDRGETHHPVVYDFDGDGDQDVAASSPHDYGLWWWQQQLTDGAQPRAAEPHEWKRRLIDDSISQLHALVAVDIDGDGDKDLLTGKRYYAHGGSDPGAEDPSMLVWYELQRDGKEATFTRHEIDDNSGVGYVVTPVDIDGDGDIDIITSNKKGVFLFEQLGSPTLLPLFNGKDLDNWIGDKSLWTVQDGAMVGRTETGIPQNNFLFSRDSYDNFVLTLEVKLEPDTANSGIQFRSEPRDDGECAGYQADIGAGWWGSIYDELGRGLLHDGYKGRGERAVIKEQWNDYVVYAVGDELRVEINGTVCTAIRDSVRSSGIIAPQIHSGGPTDIRLRNVVMRKMDPPAQAGR